MLNIIASVADIENYGVLILKIILGILFGGSYAVACSMAAIVPHIKFFLLIRKDSKFNNEYILLELAFMILPMISVFFLPERLKSSLFIASIIVVIVLAFLLFACLAMMIKGNEIYGDKDVAEKVTNLAMHVIASFLVSSVVLGYFKYPIATILFGFLGIYW